MAFICENEDCEKWGRCGKRQEAECERWEKLLASEGMPNVPPTEGQRSYAAIRDVLAKATRLWRRGDITDENMLALRLNLKQCGKVQTWGNMLQLQEYLHDKGIEAVRRF